MVISTLSYLISFSMKGIFSSTEDFMKFMLLISHRSNSLVYVCHDCMYFNKNRSSIHNYQFNQFIIWFDEFDINKPYIFGRGGYHVAIEIHDSGSHGIWVYTSLNNV